MDEYPTEQDVREAFVRDELANEGESIVTPGRPPYSTAGLPSMTGRSVSRALALPNRSSFGTFREASPV